MAKWLAASKMVRLGARVARPHSTSGGRSDTDVKELIVNPAVRPSAQREVTTATPVGKAPSAQRNSCSSVIAVSAARGDPGGLSTQRSPAARAAPQVRKLCFRIRFHVVVSRRGAALHNASAPP
jgi:hypothetical protein